MHATNTASLTLHGRVVNFASAAYGYSRLPVRLCSTLATTWKKFTRTASSARKMAAKAIRNMQVPAYWPVELGVQAAE